MFDYYTLSVANDYDELTGGVRIKNLSVTDSDKNAADDEAVFKNEYYAAFEAKNLSQNAAQITVAIAVYDEEMTLEDINIYKIDLSAGESKTITADDNIKINYEKLYKENYGDGNCSSNNGNRNSDSCYGR